jgi:hypothetical protein
MQRLAFDKLRPNGVEGAGKDQQMDCPRAEAARLRSRSFGEVSP